MIRRLFRLAVLAGVAAGVVAAVRALTSDKDPLPAPATPSEPWPPLPPEPTEATPPPTPSTPAPSPASTPPPEPTAMPEPDGVPVADAPADGAPFVEPTADGECPDGYPIKAKLSSKIFHSPGQLNYDRTTPDRCYVDAAAAEADGMRAAKR